MVSSHPARYSKSFFQTRNILLTTHISGCVAEYFNHCGGFNESGEEAHKKILSYKCVLNTKATEESMVCDRTAEMDILVIILYNLFV